VGGLSVLLPLTKQVPGARYIYAADQAWCPYGPRPVEEIRARSLLITEALLQCGAALVVVACNSASSAALATLRERFPATPFVGMEPAVKPAAERTRTGHVGVLATAATAHGERLANLIDRFGRGVTVHVHVPEGLVELIEADAGESDQATALLAPVVHSWRSAGVDTVVLGCTHYPFARRTIERLLGPGVSIVDPAPAVARQAARVLDQITNDRPPNLMQGAGQISFLTTGDPAALRAAVRRVAGAQLADNASFGQLDAAYLRSA
jgi:glutamate racemase